MTILISQKVFYTHVIYINNIVNNKIIITH